MNYIRFQITNFKGIRNTTIDLRSTGKTRAFSLIGLNESGKTTLLEAIHSFSPDPESQVLFSESSFLGQKKDDLIPRGELSDFSGEISVEATVVIDDTDLDSLERIARTQLRKEIDRAAIRREFRITYINKYNKSKHYKTETTWSIEIPIKNFRQKHFKKATGNEWRILVGHVKSRLPEIAYFPTFVFDFPAKIYLSGRMHDRTNQFYRQIFQDILDYQGEGLNIEDHIVDRMRGEEFKLPWVQFFEVFFGSSDKSKIDQVMDKASNAVSQLIFSKWNEIFNEKSTSKEIIIEWQPEEGANNDHEDGEEEEDSVKHVHDVSIRFRIKDGTNRYDVADRSLGFRWFFCFLLFTQFRTHRRTGRGTLFLFDEPASNLHAKAQEKLLESFPKICEAPNSLIYSTHSHNMVEPRWLEQAYIVENKAVDYDQSSLASVSHANKDIDIRAVPYRQFVSENPTKTSYFQPILDKLEVRPSRFDLRDSCIIIEGKSDYYIISYLAKIVKQKSLPLIPGIGATTFDVLISLLLGWNLRFFVLLDSDGEGVKAKQKYKEKYCLRDNQIGTLSELVSGVKEIEDILGPKEIDLIRKRRGSQKNPSKKQISSFFQECLSTDSIIPVSTTTRARFKKLFASLESVFQNKP